MYRAVICIQWNEHVTTRAATALYMCKSILDNDDDDDDDDDEFQAKKKYNRASKYLKPKTGTKNMIL